MKKQNRSTARQQNKLDNFLMGLVNLTLLTPQIQPLLVTDTTAVYPLRQIYAETQHDFSEKGRVLHESSQILLDAMQTVKQSYYQQHRILNNNSQCHVHNTRDRNTTKINHQSKSMKTKVCKYSQPSMQTDQNRDVSNFQHLTVDEKEHKKAKVFQLDLKEIIRPEYRRKLQIKTHRVNSEQIQRLDYTAAKDHYWNPTDQDDSLASNWDQNAIPLLKNRRKAQVSIHRGQQSKSPKVEGKKHKNMLSNISSISRNYQTQTDQSFESDIHGMGLFSDKQTENQSSRRSLSTYEGFLNQRKSNGQQPYFNTVKQNNNAIGLRVNHRFDKSDSAEIQQEQPWQCDEQQVEQELKQINQRLSTRGYQSHRFRTEVQTAKQDFNQVQNGHHVAQGSYFKYSGRTRQTDRQTNLHDRTKKQPKTVRLSLTPIKTKSPIRNGSKKQIRQISIIKTPIIEVTEAGKQQYKPYGVNCLIQPEQQTKQQLFECRKWKKPNRGLITVEIQKFAKDNN